MPEPRESRSERYLRFSQRSLAILLGLVLTMGALGLAITLRPEIGSRWMVQAGWMLPTAMVLALGALQQTMLRGERWRADAPEVRAIREDEWRQANMNRALRAALGVVLVAQVPLGLSLGQLPAMRAVMAMAVATSVLGMATLLALFLFFGREAGVEAGDGR
jgi:hypothetical protein